MIVIMVTIIVINIIIIIIIINVRRVKKRKEMPNLNYFVPHRSDLIETYVR